MRRTNEEKEDEEFMMAIKRLKSNKLASASRAVSPAALNNIHHIMLLVLIRQCFLCS
jgi:hypothetical protein